MIYDCVNSSDATFLHDSIETGLSKFNLPSFDYLINRDSSEDSIFATIPSDCIFKNDDFRKRVKPFNVKRVDVDSSPVHSVPSSPSIHGTLNGSLDIKVLKNEMKKLEDVPREGIYLENEDILDVFNHYAGTSKVSASVNLKQFKDVLNFVIWMDEKYKYGIFSKYISKVVKSE